jgi:hypothetical protein
MTNFIFFVRFVQIPPFSMVSSTTKMGSPAHNAVKEEHGSRMSLAQFVGFSKGKIHGKPLHVFTQINKPKLLPSAIVVFKRKV